LKKIDTQGGHKPPLCILGTAETLAEAPYGDDSVEMWAAGTTIAIPTCERADKVFEMHPRRYWSQINVLDRYVDFSGDVYMQEHYEEIPNSKAFPYDEIKKYFHLDAMGDNLYVTNTITWMLLLAIYQGYTDISLYGVHMSHDTEYAYQRSSCSWALGIIHGLMLSGKKYTIRIPEKSALLKAEYEYGYEEPTKAMQYIKGRIDGLKYGVSEASGQITALNEQKLKTEGAISEANHIYEKIAGFK
jgi:hypothetical protein